MNVRAKGRVNWANTRIQWFMCIGWLICLAHSVRASETVWQYEQDIDSARGNSALLWIPPHCSHVRGIIYGQQVILENCLFSDPAIRNAAADEGLALLLCSPGIDFSKPESDGPGKLEDLLKKLAEQSGHSKLAEAPLLPIGHSGGAIFAWYVGYQMPSRVFALLTLKSVPIEYPNWSRKWNNQSVIDGIPILCVSGQYESWDGGPAIRHIRWLRGIAFALRGFDQNILISEYVDAGTTHFGWTPQLAGFCAQFIRTAAERRLPRNSPADDQPVPLTPLAIESGWMTDFSLNSPTVFPTTAYPDYTGDRLLAFWHMTKDLALRDDQIAKAAYGKKVQMVSFEQDGKLLAPAWIQNVKFQPEADGVTVKVKAGFLDKTPEAIPPAGRAIGHAPGPILYRLIGGWCGGGEQTGPDTFRILPEALSFTKGYGSLMIMAYQPGDDVYSYAEQACHDRIPSKEHRGAASNHHISTAAEDAQGRRGSAVATRGQFQFRSAGAVYRHGRTRGGARLDSLRSGFAGTCEIPHRASHPRVAMGPFHQSPGSDGAARGSNDQDRALNRSTLETTTIEPSLMKKSSTPFVAALALGLAGIHGIAQDQRAHFAQLTAAANQANAAAEPVADGPFKPDWDSLKQYQFPEWFRDAKFGIWAHWGPQCEPEMGDWYARNMYSQYNKKGEPNPDYAYHVAHYGHPSVFGFKDVIPLWTAANWDPDKLMQLYKRAGAKYFMALANHHDNFDTWNSKYQPWNAVNIGPKKDLIAGWSEAARKAGLRFGVSVHSARAWDWNDGTLRSDQDGPKAGVQYDGRLTAADGKGLWWDGLDPQDLYAQNHGRKERPGAAYMRKFFNRTMDLINRYHPDLLYFDESIEDARRVGVRGGNFRTRIYELLTKVVKLIMVY